MLVGLCQRQGQGMLRETDRLTVAPHVRVAADGVPHLREGHAGHGDGAAAQHLEAGLAVEGDEEVLAHQHRSAHIGQAAEVLQVAPHQDGTFALLPEGAVDSEDVDVDGGAAGLVESQRVLEQRGWRSELLTTRTFMYLFWRKLAMRWKGTRCLTVVSLSWSHREPMIKATSRPSSNQPMDSSGHSVRK